jgi:NitT/TauT family transport system substrate-binding protein
MPFRSRRRAIHTAWLGLLTAALAGPLAASAQQSPKLTPLKVGVLKMAALTNPWVAKQRGIFERNGLDVTLVEFRSGNEAISAHRGGSVDVVLAIPGTAMTAIERGFDLVAVAQNEIAQKQGPDTGSVQVLKDSPYKALADLAGKKIAVSGLHSQKTVAMQTVFRNAGVDPAKLVLVEIPFSSQADALKSKQVDAINTVDPYTTQVLAMGLGRVIAWDYVDSIPEQPLGAWFARSTFTKSNPDVIDRFNKSIKESIDYMWADQNRARSEVVAYTGLDAALVKEMPMIGWDYKVRLEKWQAVVDMMVANGELQSKHRAEEFLSEQIKPYVVK